MRDERKSEAVDLSEHLRSCAHLCPQAPCGDWKNETADRRGGNELSLKRLSLTDWIRRAVIQEGLRIEVLLLNDRIKKEPVAWKRLGVTPEELEEVAGEREVGRGKWQGMDGWKKTFYFGKQYSNIEGFFPQICFVL